jgi:catalase-peroxidase
MKHLRLSLLLVYSAAIVGLLTSQSLQAADHGMHGYHNKSKRAAMPKNNQFWWPDQLDLSRLRDHDSRSNPYGDNFDYAKEFAKLDLKAVKENLNKLLTNSQDWWPADFGNYGPFFVRLSWHSAGTYRTLDGRGGGEGGQMRFDPLNSWPDNGNLDKARRLLWPLKKKYGRALSWGDLMIMAGTVGMENMGFKTYGFAGGRTDDWEPDIVYWGPEVKMLASDRDNKKGALKRPLGATHMGLIYVNPQGPKGKPDPMGSAKNIRTTFGRMAMNDEETVALVAGGHTFGKMHGAHKARCMGPEPGGAPTEQQGLGWKNKCGKGHSEDTVTSGFEGAWTQAPTKWTSLYLSNLLNNRWMQTRSPHGNIQWIPRKKELRKTVPDAHIKGKMTTPVMTTADIAIKTDPAYRKIAERFLKNPEEFRLAFAKAWFKLTHRDMGPRNRYLGPLVPEGEMIWQDPVPKGDNIGSVSSLKSRIMKSGLTVPQLVRTAWASASSFRASDMRGGANGARVRLEPQKSWPENDPKELAMVLNKLEDIRSDYNDSMWRSSKVSMADMIIIGGAAAIEAAAEKAGMDIEVPVITGRGDSSQAQTDVNSFAMLHLGADGFRNYFDKSKSLYSPTEALVNKADLLNLTVPEMTVLVGGMRVLGGNAMGSKHGVFTNRVGVLTNDFFVNLLDMSTTWKKSKTKGLYEGIDRKTGKAKYTATSVDLIFGSNSELRAIAEVYAMDDAKKKFAQDFVNAWVKVMRLDRFDLRHQL